MCVCVCGVGPSQCILNHQELAPITLLLIGTFLHVVLVVLLGPFVYYCEWVEGLFHMRSTDKLFLPQGPEFIFPVESRKRSWNEKMFTRTGSSYVTGILLPLQLWYCCSLLLLVPQA